jgi:NhaP-type Na+/H+ or K+/H+ antiporter
MTGMKILIFSALLCSSDTVAAVSIVDFKSQPKLFSCILGEGVFNDIVAITLYVAIVSLQGKEFSPSTLWLLSEQFAVVGLISIVIGAFFGFASTLCFKSARFLNRSVVTETFLMFAIGMLSYFSASLIEIKGIAMSGIISLLSCGVIQAHYCWYNLSPQG